MQALADLEHTRRRRRRLWPRLLLVLVSAALTALVADRVLWAFNLFGVAHASEGARFRAEVLAPVWNRPDGTPDFDGELLRLRPATETRFQGFSVRINALGFRGPETTMPKPPGVYRIVALGDSVTFGWGVDDEHTFLRRLEADLNAGVPGRRFEVINTGLPGYDSVQELATLERRALALSPDLVLLTYVVNDIDPTRDVLERYLEQSGSAAPDSSAESLLGDVFPALSSLARTCSARWSTPSLDMRSAKDRFVLGRQAGWRRSQDALRRMRDLCAARGVRFLVLDHTPEWIEDVAAFCEAERIPCYPFRFDAAESARPIRNSWMDPHANRLGHELLLVKLKRALREAGLFDLR